METEDFVEVGVGLCVEICGDVLLGVIDDSVAESRVVGKEVVGSGAVVFVEVDFMELGCGVEREVTASRVVGLRVEDSRVVGSKVVDSKVVDSGVVDLRVVVSRFIILRVVGSCEVVSSEMVLGAVVSGSNIVVVVGDFAISVVVGIGVVLELADEVSGFVDVLILTPPADELEVISLSSPPPLPPFLAPSSPPTEPSVVASPLFPSLVVADSPSVVRGLSTCLSIKLHGSEFSTTGAAATPSCSINPA